MASALTVQIQYDAACIDPELASSLSSWRNSLFCASKTRPLLYLASQDRILVFERVPRGLIDTSETSDVNDPVKGRARPLQCIMDVFNPPPPEIVRRPYGHRPGMFDNAQINSLATFTLGTQEVLISADGLGRIIVRSLDDLEVRPLMYGVASSTWGIFLHHRILAVSSNSHEVYMLNLEQRDEDSQSKPESEKLRLVGALANIPNIAISSDGSLVASVDVWASVHIWQVNDADFQDTEVIQSKYHVQGDDDWDAAWACLWIPEPAFREITCREASEQSNAKRRSNPIRSLCPNLPWWSAVGANISSGLDDRPPLTTRERMLTIRFATSGAPISSEFERHWQAEHIELFEDFVQYNNTDLLLVTLVDRIVLLHASDYMQVHAVCFYPFGARVSTNYAFERINLVKPCFELCLVVIATQRGNVGVFELIKCAERDELKQTTRYSYSMRCTSILSEEEIRDDGELIGLDVVQSTPRSATAIMLFRSGRVVTMEIERSDDWMDETENVML